MNTNNVSKLIKFWSVLSLVLACLISVSPALVCLAQAPSAGELRGKLAEASLASPIVGVYYQADGGGIETLYGLNTGQTHSPASLVKLMTILVADEELGRQGRSWADQYEVRPEDYAGLVEGGIAVCGFAEGDQLSFEDLICGTLIASGADAVNALISALGLSQAEFVEKLNQRAGQMGIRAHFTDGIGLYSDQQYVTADAVAAVLGRVLDRPRLRQIMHYKQYTFPALVNFPAGLTIDHSMNMYAGQLGLDTGLIQGGKTGWISQSGYNLASFQELAGGRLYLVTMGAAAPGQQVLDHLDILTRLGGLVDLTGAANRDLASLEARINELRYGQAPVQPDEAQPKPVTQASEQVAVTQPGSEESESPVTEPMAGSHSQQVSASQTIEPELEKLTQPAAKAAQADLADQDKQAPASLPVAKLNRQGAKAETVIESSRESRGLSQVKSLEPVSRSLSNRESRAEAGSSLKWFGLGLIAIVSACLLLAGLELARRLRSGG